MNISRKSSRCLRIYVCLCVYIYLCMYLYIYLWIFIFTHIYMYTYIYLKYLYIHMIGAWGDMHSQELSMCI
jgi:hypothetical protein